MLLSFFRRRMDPYPKFGSDVKTDDMTHIYHESMKTSYYLHIKFSGETMAGLPG